MSKRRINLAQGLLMASCQWFATASLVSNYCFFSPSHANMRSYVFTLKDWFLVTESERGFACIALFPRILLPVPDTSRIANVTFIFIASSSSLLEIYRVAATYYRYSSALHRYLLVLARKSSWRGNPSGVVCSISETLGEFRRHSL